MLLFLITFPFLFATASTIDPLPKCQLPAFTNLLPLNSRRELRKIWSGFHSTTSAKKCDRQLAQTKELINELPDDIKLRILEFDKPVPTTTERTRTNFLAGLSDEQTRRFSEIMSNRSITHEFRYNMLRTWASEHLDLDMINQVEQFITFQQRRNQSFKLKIERLSSEARIAHDRLESLRRLKQEVYQNMTEAARKELANLYRAKCTKGSVYESSDLDAEELQLACSVDERMPLFRTTTTISVTTKEPTRAVESTTSSGEESTSKSTSRVTTDPSTTTTTSETTSVPVEITTVGSTSDSALWVRLTSTTGPAKLSYEIEKSKSVKIPARPSMSSMFVADPEKLSDLLKKIFNKPL